MHGMQRRMHPTNTDLPFKLSEERIVILKQLPVLQCGACREYLIEDTVMARIDILLAQADIIASFKRRYARVSCV